MVKLQQEEECEYDIRRLLREHQLTTIARNSEASLSLSDKNRLLANVNSNIQQKFTKLEDVNNKINTITQDIYTNNMEMKRKEYIIQTLKVIIFIVILMAIVLMIYFGMDIIEKKYPNVIKNITNNFNRNNQNIFF
jgi:hypothetical protein